MGGLFSSNTTPDVQTTAKQEVSYESAGFYNHLQNRITTQRNSSTSFDAIPSYHVINSYRKIVAWNSIQKTQENSTAQSNSQVRNYDPYYFSVPLRVITFFAPPIYELLPIEKSEYEYQDIRRRITNRHFVIHSIEKIENISLESSYSLVKKQKLEYYTDLEELELFHGTKWIYADSICKNNFNWRCHGKEVGHKYGKGVSFSCNAMYAANYSDTGNQVKVMFIAKVLIGQTCLGSKYMELPPEGYDTTTKQNDNIVVVKYQDNEFLPIYRITFHISPGYVPMNKRIRYNRYQNLN